MELNRKKRVVLNRRHREPVEGCTSIAQGSVEIKMANIIQFPIDRVNSANSVKTLSGTTAEIIIFPGIRFEHHGVSFAVAK